MQVLLGFPALALLAQLAAARVQLLVFALGLLELAPNLCRIIA